MSNIEITIQMKIELPAEIYETPAHAVQYISDLLSEAKHSPHEKLLDVMADKNLDSQIRDTLIRVYRNDIGVVTKMLRGADYSAKYVAE